MRFSTKGIGPGFLFVILQMLTISSFAQNRQLYNVKADSLPFEKFIENLEIQTEYRFFYRASELKDLNVNINAKEKSIDEILTLVLQGSVFHFFIDPRNYIYITKANSVAVNLPPIFFSTSLSSGDSLKLTDIIKDKKNKDKISVSLENKLIEIGSKNRGSSAGNATIDGYIKDIKTGEPLASAALIAEPSNAGAVTDQFGYFSLSLPRGKYIIRISSVGMKNTMRQVALYDDGKLNIEMEDFIPSLKAVIVVADKVSNLKGLQMGMEKLSIKTIRQLPVAFGEADVLRSILTLPGVTSVGEATTGFNVRGGSSDQNLVLFSDAAIYNPSHLFGFFSAFNPDVIQDVELYKSSIPEKYGGRISSVLDINNRIGNKKKITGIGGVSPLTSKLTIEGPIVKDKTTFLIGGRSSYSDWILKNIPNSEFHNSSAGFYDFDVHINHEFDNKNNLFINAYFSNDHFKLNTDTVYRYRNENFNLKWKHIFNNKLNAVFLFGHDYYNYTVTSDYVKEYAYKLAFDIGQYNFKSDFAYIVNPKHTLNFGINSIYYQLHPGSYTPLNSVSIVIPDVLKKEQGLESAAYFGDKFDITTNLSVQAGIRYSAFSLMGPASIYSYKQGVPRTDGSITDSSTYSSGKFIKTYHGAEYRVSVRYSLPNSFSVKLAFNTLQQYIHMLSNSTIISPTDTWKLSDPNIKPQYGAQYSLGLYKNLKSNAIETSVEFYYKRLNHYLDYKSGAKILLNQHIETDVVNTRGYAYGAELMIKKRSGKLNGWISYTYSRTLLRQDDPLAGETINKGKYYPANFDKPHIGNIVSNYKFSHRYSVSLDFAYSTGRPITLPIALYTYSGSQRVYYSDRNGYRIPDYFRADFSFNIEGNHKIKQLTHNSWSMGVYNLTGRKNVYSVYFVQEGSKIVGYKMSIFGSAIPYVTFNFRF